MYYENQNYIGALTCFQKMVELAPQSEFGYLDVGDAYEKLGLAQEAINAYRQALEINPDRERTLKAIERLTSPQ